MINEFKDQYRFLSNFYWSPIFYQEKLYPTAGHLFQALKTKDKKERDKIRIARTPGIAKKIGQTVSLKKDWEKIKDKLMYMIVRLKFLQNTELKLSLFNTKDSTLIEGNYWHDNYWGGCFCSKCKLIQGKNQLGKILMRIREKNNL